MAFEVLITDEAFGDLDAIVGYIEANSSLERARMWFDSIVRNIQTPEGYCQVNGPRAAWYSAGWP